MSKAWPVENLAPEESIAVNARRILRVRTGEYYSYEPVVDQPQAVEPLHDMRISAKRLRYTLELFRPLLGPLGEISIDRVKAIQEELGNLHDTDVRIALIREELQVISVEQLDHLCSALASSPVESYPSLLTSALRPPPDDPRRGLVSQLIQQYRERSEHYLAFKRLWDQFEADGMRADLVTVSTDPAILIEP